MPPTLDTRKPVVKLTASDLRTFPVWEFAIDEEGRGKQDESWVRPVRSKLVPKNAYSQIVATEFTTPGGSKLRGFMIVTTAEGCIEVSAGAIVGKFGYRTLPTMSRKLATRRKAEWSIEIRDRTLKALREAEDRVFPLKYQLDVPICGEERVRKGTLK